MGVRGLGGLEGRGSGRQQHPQQQTWVQLGRRQADGLLLPLASRSVTNTPLPPPPPRFNCTGPCLLLPQPLPSKAQTPLPSLLFLCAGLYLASAGQDQALVVWDVNERTCLEKRLLPGCATGLAWHPTHNALAVITEDGGCCSNSSREQRQQFRHLPAAVHAGDADVGCCGMHGLAWGVVR